MPPHTLDRLKNSLRKGAMTKDFILGEELGKGAFGTVFLVTHKKTGREYAAKEIALDALSKSDIESLKTEILVLESIEHPNVVALEAVYRKEKKLHMVMELVRGGEMFDRVVQRGFFSERQAAQEIRQVLQCLSFLHAHGVVHRDLKPENLMYVSDDENAKVKVIDFGLACILQEPGETATKACGTPGYAAPEVLLGHPYNELVDIWSLGAILYILLSGTMPFYGDDARETIRSSIKCVIEMPDEEWGQISTEAKDVVRKMLEKDPKKRPSAAALLKHKWFKNAASLSSANIHGLVDRMKRFNARRHFRKHVHAIVAANRINVALGKLGKS